MPGGRYVEKNADANMSENGGREKSRWNSFISVI